MTKRSGGFSVSGDELKWIAIWTMLIDHIGAAVLGCMLKDGFFPEESYFAWWVLYKALRAVGRIAFPIFAFLLVEGFFHTGSRGKYLLRLLIGAVLSEIPFDLAFYREITWEHQNVFLTLAIGFLALWMLEIWGKLEKKKLSDCKAGGKAAVSLLFFVLMLATAAGACILADFLHTDYGFRGILLVLVIYMMQIYCVEMKYICIVGCLMFLNSPAAIAGFLLIYFYNGRRKQISPLKKYFFYLFYPAHLLILTAVRVAILGK